MLSASVLLGLLSLLPGGEKPAPPQAVIGGTVFKEPGFALRGATVELQPNLEVGASNKVKKMKTATDARGEFTFRVPAAAMRYTLTFQAVGCVPETRPVVISGEERQEVYVTLKAAPKEDSR